ncbi:MAG: hypothetical protein K9L74_02445 [Candidatus Izimaplasma sp.]|nr:hypothetical protein [Candidatus Izimaplasma bacterium]
MEFTFLLDYAIIMVFFLGFFIYFGYFGYVIYLLLFSKNKFQNLNTLQKTVSITFLVFSLLYILTYVTHQVQSGLYHDENGTGPSDAENNFLFIELVFAYLMLLISNISIRTE